MTHVFAFRTVFPAKKGTKRRSKHLISVSMCYLWHLDGIPKKRSFSRQLPFKVTFPWKPKVSLFFNFIQQIFYQSNTFSCGEVIQGIYKTMERDLKKKGPRSAIIAMLQRCVSCKL